MIADDRNPELQAARWQVRVNEGNRRQAGLYPNPSFMLEQDEMSVDTDGDGLGMTMGYIRQPIVIGGRLGSDKRQAEAEILASIAALEMKRRQVFRQVETSFFEINYHTAHYLLQLELFHIASEVLEIAEDLYRGGEIHQYDLMRARNKVDRLAVETTRIFAERLYLVQRLSETLGGYPIRAELIEADLIDGMVPHLTSYDLEQETLNNPEIQFLDFRIQALQQRRESYRRQNTPDVTVFGGAGYQHDMDESRFALGVEFALPIFNRNQGNIQSAEAEIEMLKAQRLEVELRIRRALLESRQQLNEYDSFVRDYADTILPDAIRGHQDALDKFRNGDIPFMDYIMIQENYFDAENAHKQSLFLLNRTIAEMRFLRGMYDFDQVEELFEYSR